MFASRGTKTGTDAVNHHICVFACAAAQKTALIVYAHQSPNSFNAAVRDVTMQELSAQGYRVVVSDLYAMNFKASATREDIIGDLTITLSVNHTTSNRQIAGSNIKRPAILEQIACWDRFMTSKSDSAPKRS